MAGKTYLDLLVDSDVKHWYENLRRGSKVHGDLSLKRLRAFCMWSGISPKEIIARDKQSVEDFQHLVEDYVSYLEHERKAPAYVVNLLKPIRSWLEYKHAPRLSPVRITDAGVNITTMEERVPTKEELSKIFRFLEPRERAAAALIAFAGLRIEVLGNYDGTDGLVLEDLPELAIKEDSIVFEKMPAIIVVRPSLSKAGHRYFTFLSSEGCNYLKEYLESRLSNGQTLTEKSTVISTYRNVKNRFLYATKVADHIRTGIRAAGFKWRPYVLRSYTDTSFDIAESKGLISHPWRQFFMGHKGDIEARYSTNKGRLPTDMIEEMRASYKKCESLLQTIGGEATSEEKLKDTFRKQLLLVAGYKQDEVDEMDLSSITDEEFQNMARQRLLGLMTNNGSKQKLVKTGEVENYLTQGWEFVASLPNNKTIIKISF